MSDLLYYADTVILRYRPALVFIYEGDNDLADGEMPAEILTDARKLVQLIRHRLPGTAICFISPKPSILRWNLKDSYLEYNKQLKKFTASQKRLYYLDVWEKMLDPDGNPMGNIFLDDGLHLNRKGYDLWKDMVGEFLKKHPIRGKA